MKNQASKKYLRSFAAFSIAVFVFCALFAPFYVSASVLATEPSTSAQSAILIDAEDRSVIYQKNAHARMGMASTTKIMTALVVCELLPLDRVISIPREAVGIEGSSVYLCEGEMLTEFFSTLDRRKISVSCLRIVNSPTSPFFFIAENR